jgi:hypothetical protein
MSSGRSCQEVGQDRGDLLLVDPLMANLVFESFVKSSLHFRPITDGCAAEEQLETTWNALCDGKYDWAHGAMHLWPGRVVLECATDRSFATAHRLEDVLWVKAF